MPQVPLTINGRTYRLGCADADVARLQEVGAMLAQKVDGLVAEFGQAGDARLLLMAGLLVADELIDTRAALDAAIAESSEALRRAAAEAMPAAAAAVASAELPAATDKVRPQKQRVEVPGKASSGG